MDHAQPQDPSSATATPPKFAETAEMVDDDDEEDALFSDSSDEEGDDNGTTGPLKSMPATAGAPPPPAADTSFSSEATRQRHSNDPRFRSTVAAASRVSPKNEEGGGGGRKEDGERPVAAEEPCPKKEEFSAVTVPSSVAESSGAATSSPRRQANGSNNVGDGTPGLDVKTAPMDVDDDESKNVVKEEEPKPIDLPKDVVHIDEIEWATPEQERDRKCEFAPRPPFERSDPCGCVPDSSGNMCCVDMSCVLFACQEECRSDCTAGNRCGNRRITRKEWKNLQVFDAGLKGRGLRTLDAVKKDELVTEYVGVAVKKRFMDDLFRRYRNERMLYIMVLDTNVYIDARKRGGIARYINHSCEPNCVVHRWKVRGVNRAGIFAIRDIEPGEELSFDYQWERRRGRAPTKCYCMSKSCRGTLEMPMVTTLVNEEEEVKNTGHWVAPISMTGATTEIVNRCIKVYFEGNHEYFVADVCRYDSETGKHLLIYKQDLEEHWEDLSKEQWLILDEDSQFVIAKKAKVKSETSLLSSLDQPDDSLRAAVTGGGPEAMLMQTPGKREKNYLIVQTPVKEALKDMLFKCQRHCRVQINISRCVNRTSMTSSPGSDGNDDEEEMAAEEARALEASKDGTAWKLTIAGLEPAKARAFLDWNAQDIQKRLDAESIAEEEGAKKQTDASSSPGGGGGAVHRTSASANSTQNTAGPTKANGVTQEMIIPRCIVDIVKKRIHIIRTKCQCINVSFVHSDSISKLFAKLILEGSLASDLRRAEDVLYREVWNHCNAAKAPLTPTGQFRNLAYLGGTLPSDQFDLLFPKLTDRLSQDCNEDLRKCPFVSSFEDTQRCSLWVQSEEDMGRIDSNNCVVYQPVPNSPRKVFFGCEPNRIPTLWALIENRASELSRGVKYVELGSDRVYQPVLLQKVNRKNHRQRDDFFFDYVRKTTGARVSVDSLTRNHLRIDGGEHVPHQSSPLKDVISIDDDSSPPERHQNDVEHRIAFAEELIHLQIELFRDHFILQQRWGFGRDWTLLDFDKTFTNLETSTPTPIGSRAGPISPRQIVTTATRNLFDSRSVAHACMEIADITSSLHLDGSVAAHATIILYRFLNQLSQSNNNNSSSSSQLKLREVTLSCIFLANKAQKVSKWKRLESVLEAAYRAFYGAGTIFNESSEEAAIWERRVLAAESDILAALQYDVFWPGMDWIMTAATESGSVAEPLAQNAMELALSGPVLAAGPTLWLKYGPEYAFAAMAGFISINLDHLFGALSLIPLKVSHAAELIATSVKTNSYGKNKNPSSRSNSGGNHELLNGGKETLLNNVPHIQQVCQVWMSRGGSSPQAVAATGFGANSAARQHMKQFQIVGRRDRRRRVLRGVNVRLLQSRILPVLDGICADSKCSIYLEESELAGREDVYLEGSWRALAIAERLLQQSAVVVPTNPPREGGVDEAEDEHHHRSMTTTAASSSSQHKQVRPRDPRIRHDEATAAFVSASSVGSSERQGPRDPRIRIVEGNASASSVVSASSMELPPVMQPLPAAVDVVGAQGLVKMQAKLQPGLLKMSSVCTTDGWEGTIQSRNFETTDSSSSSAAVAGRRSAGGKTCLAGKVPESALCEAGLRWWIPPCYGPSLSGSLCAIFAVRQSLASAEENGRDSSADAVHLDALAQLSRALVGNNTASSCANQRGTMAAASSSSLPLLGSLASSSATGGKTEEKSGAGGGANNHNDRFVAVSLQRWPPEKVEARERSRKTTASSTTTGSLGGGGGMELGFSAAALQEMQLLNQLHSTIPAPQGHPNFILPVAVAIPDDRDDDPTEGGGSKLPNSSTALNKSDDVFSLLRTSEENERKAKREQKRKSTAPKGHHLVFHPTPFILQKIFAKCKRRGDSSKQQAGAAVGGGGALVTPPLFASWFHDLLSALAHCHSNHVVLRTIRPDQILIDQSGVAKLSGLVRAIVLHPDDRGRSLDPLKNARARARAGGETGGGDNDEVLTNPFIAPELLLGAMRYTKETDVWSIGCLMANLLLNKPLFTGRDRASKILAIFKIVGSPAMENYSDGRKFPYYEDPPKKYKRGVQKALRFMMKKDQSYYGDADFIEENYSGAMDLLEQMLHLDPRKRITAADALEHEFMVRYVESTNSDEFRNDFVKSWMNLKCKLMVDDDNNDNGDPSTSSSTKHRDKAGQDHHNKKSKIQEKETKRKAWLMEAASSLGGGIDNGDDDEDDLYNLDDLLGKSSSKNDGTKRLKKE